MQLTVGMGKTATPKQQHAQGSPIPARLQKPQWQQQQLDLQHNSSKPQHVLLQLQLLAP